MSEDGTDGDFNSGHGPPADNYELSFGDVPLGVIDSGLSAEIEAFIYQYLPLRKYFEQPYPPAGGWMASADSQWPITPELNTLYWPTGCTRWGFGVFLVSGEYLERIKSAVASNGTALLKGGNPDDPDHYIEAEMFPLSPVAVTGNSSTSNTTDGYPLYLLPLVDKRYQAQMYPSTAGFNGGQVQPGDTAQMTEFFIDANAAVGGSSIPYHSSALPSYATYADAKATTYTIPTNFHSAMQAAESAAWSLGLTLVMELDGTGGFMHRDAFTGQDTNTSRFASLKSQIADGVFQISAGYVAEADEQATLDNVLKPSIPESILMYVAPAADLVESDNYTIASSKVFIVTSDEILGYTGQAQSWSIVSPIVRDVDRDVNGDPTGTGTTAADDLCQQLLVDIANEWYNQVAKPIDVTFANICNIPLSSHTDLVEWHFGRRGPQTRVRSRRWNAFPNRLINQFKASATDNHAPHRFERVTVVGTGGGLTGQVRWNQKLYDAEFPRTPDGFVHFADGDSVIAGWEPIERKFWVCDQQDLDLDFIAENTANWMQQNGWLDPPAAGGGGVGGGAL